jgi:hypothetical protein
LHIKKVLFSLSVVKPLLLKFFSFPTRMISPTNIGRGQEKGVFSMLYIFIFLLGFVSGIGCLFFFASLKASGKRNKVSPVSPDQMLLDVVGESECQDDLEDLAGGKTPSGVNVALPGELVAETKHKIIVKIKGIKVGYLPPASIEKLTGVAAGLVIPCTTQIVGGWCRPDGDEGFFGVKCYVRRS